MAFSGLWMLKSIAGGPLGRVVGMAVFAVGFWLLFKGFLDSSVLLGVLGGVMIPLGMWIMTQARGRAPGQP